MATGNNKSVKAPVTLVHYGKYCTRTGALTSIYIVVQVHVYKSTSYCLNNNILKCVINYTNQIMLIVTNFNVS